MIKLLAGLENFLCLLQFLQLAFFFFKLFTHVVDFLFLFCDLLHTTSTGVFFTQGFLPSLADAVEVGGLPGGDKSCFFSAVMMNSSFS